MDDTGRVLLVEGKNDKHVVRHLCYRNESMPEFRIQVKDNVDTLLNGIGAELKVSGRKVLGIIVDANEDLHARWDAVVNRLRSESIDVPYSGPDPSGIIVECNPRVGIWFMPNNRAPGELENFISEMIPEDDPIWPRSEEYIDSIPSTNRKFKDKKVLRAKIHAWLATRENPRFMGQAIGAGDLKTDGPLSQTFVEWLRKLYG